MTSILKALVILVCGLFLPGNQVKAEDLAPDLTVSLGEIGPVKGERPQGYLPGDIIDATVLLRNAGDKALTLHRIVLQYSPSVVPLDPATDSIDNDGDGVVDGPTEAFQRRDSSGAAWRFGMNDISVEPGETLRRRLRFEVQDDVLPGTSGFFSVSTGTTLSEGARSRPQRTKRTFAVSFAPPALRLSLDTEGDLLSSDTPILTGIITLPGSSLPDASLELALHGGWRPGKGAALSLGDAVTCASDTPVQVTHTGLLQGLQACEVDQAQPEEARRIRVTLPLVITDAAPDESEEDIAAARKLSAALTLRNRQTVLGTTRLSQTLHGPLPRLTALDTTRPALSPGDTFSARYRIENRGDRPILSPRIRISNDETAECRELVSDDTKRPIACDGVALLSAQIAPGQSRAFTATAHLRDDALIERGTGLALELVDETQSVTPFPSLPFIMASHGTPQLEIEEAGTVERDETGFSGSIGATATLSMKGTLPKGRYPGAIRLLARMVDPQTGRPVAPAMLEVVDSSLVITDAGGDEASASGPVTLDAGAIWSTYEIPYDLTAKTKATEPREWQATLEVRITDDPAMKRDRLIELVAETLAFGESAASAVDWREILITEPDVRLKFFSRDEDRIVQPGENFDAVALACNYGDSVAHSARLRIDLPSQFESRDVASSTEIFRLPLDAVFDDGALVEERVPRREAGGSFDISVDENVLTLVQDDASPLLPGDCLGVEIVGQFKLDRENGSQSATLNAVLERYQSGQQEGARVYESKSAAPLKFRAPQMRFGPPAVLFLDGDARVSHEVKLEVPRHLGPYRITLDMAASSGLDWSIQRQDAERGLIPWQDLQTIFEPGDDVVLVLEGKGPEDLPLGWSDTTTARAVIDTEDGRRFPATTRIVTRKGTANAERIETRKRIALDRDCDGLLGDEDAQDALFEPGKDAAPGECVLVRIEFINGGKTEVERIIIRDSIPRETRLMPTSAAVRIAPEPLDSVMEPDGTGNALEWQFKGLFRPGALGEVEYGLRIRP